MDFRVKFKIGLESNPWMEPFESFSWTKNNAEKLLDDVLKIRPSERAKIKQLKALVMGPHGAGKSSLINSFASISAGGNVTVCNAAEMIDVSNVTTIFRCFEFPDKLDQCCLGDIPGLHCGDNVAVFIENIKLIVKGHVKSGYTLMEKRIISKEDPYYRPNPELSDRFQCVIIVIDGAILDIHNNYKKSIESVKETLNAMNVPVMVVLTKADMLSEHVKHSIDKIYRCRKVRDAVKYVSKQLGVPFSSTFPVVNFDQMHSFTWRDSIPVLLVLRFYLQNARMYSHNAS